MQMQMQGHPDAANMSKKAYENGDLIRGSSNVLRGGLDALDIAVSDSEDGGVPEVKVANLQGDLRGSVQSKSSGDLGKGGGFDEDVVLSARSIIWYSSHVSSSSTYIQLNPTHVTLKVAGCQRRMNGFCFGRIKRCCSGM